ncbi:Phospholipase D1 [Borealophlyctis nickersoniae]|nr:Phospholipase D1 [Borealophlyctis nickersoniae]
MHSLMQAWRRMTNPDFKAQDLPDPSLGPGEYPDYLFVPSSDRPFPEPTFAEMQVKLLKSTPYFRQHWYSGRRDTFNNPHNLDAHEIEFRHGPTGVHWTLSIRPKDIHKISKLLADPESVTRRHQQHHVKKLAKADPPKRPEEQEDPGAKLYEPTAFRPLPAHFPRNAHEGKEIVDYLDMLLKEIREPWNIYGTSKAAIEERRRGFILAGFIELSRKSLVGAWPGGAKGKEGWIRKRRGGRKNDALRPNYLVYFYAPTDLVPSEVMLIDGYFQVLHQGNYKELDLKPKEEDVEAAKERVAVHPGGRQHHHNPLRLRPFNSHINEHWAKQRYHIAILNGFRDLLITVAHEDGGRARAQLMKEWIAQLQYLRENCSWCVDTQVGVGRYDSFAPIRDGIDPTQLRWMIDGSAHFEQIYDAFNNAKKEILIADWWLTPEVFLQRGEDGIYPEHLRTRLDRTLIRKANEGIRVYVLLYKELNLPNDSLHVKEVLMGRKKPNYMLDPAIEDPDGELILRKPENIIVMRHPDQGRGFTGVLLDSTLWAHHEKIAVVDRKIAFVGGIDLCDGRYDTAEHTLKDDVVYQDGKPVMTRTQSNSTAVDESQGRKTEITGAPTKGIRDPASPTVGHEDENAPKRGKEEATGTPVANVFPGQDYSNPRVKDFKDVGPKPFETLIDRTLVARLPWHDVSVTFRKSPGEENIEGPVDDLVWHFVQRWNFAKWEKKKRDPHIPYLYLSQGLIRPTAEHKKGTIQMQILRSASQWSAGNPRERSIQNAYIDMIKNAKHYVYIENQFFISKFDNDKTAKKGSGQLFPKSQVRIHNKVARVLIERIIKAHENGENFRAYIIIPLYPGFQGDVRGKGSDPALPFVLSAQCETITGFMTELKKGGIPDREVEKYVMFLGLRKWDILGKRLVAEQVYIHAKIMIVDDRQLICGSANINDRSQLGARDSEVATIITDTQHITTRMNGQSYPQASHFIYTMRLRLFHEHLGIPFDSLRDIHDPVEPTQNGYKKFWNKLMGSTSTPDAGDLSDPVSDACWNTWLDRVNVNTETFREVFHCLPDDTVKTWKQAEEFTKARGGEEEEAIEKDMDYMSAEQGVAANLTIDGKLARDILLDRIRGHAVRFPVNFLEDEDLSQAFKGLAALAPRVVFT